MINIENNYSVKIQPDIFPILIYYHYGDNLDLLLDKEENPGLKKVLKKIIKSIKKGSQNIEARYHSHKGVQVIYVKKQNNIPDIISCTTHEIIHAIHDGLHRLGLNLTYDSEETYAYLSGYIMRQVLSNLITNPPTEV